jgi:hypothetical protein
MTAKKILNCARALVVLSAITMGFIIALNQKPTKDTGLIQPTNLEQVNAKLDQLLEEGRERDTVILRQILELRQQAGQVPQDRLAKVSQN